MIDIKIKKTLKSAVLAAEPILTDLLIRDHDIIDDMAFEEGGPCICPCGSGTSVNFTGLGESYIVRTLTIGVCPICGEK